MKNNIESIETLQTDGVDLCPVCSTKLLSSGRWLRVGCYKYALCPFCKSFYLNPLPPPEETEKIYRDPSYFFEIYGDYFSSRASYRNFFRWFSHVEKYLPDKNCKIAEIGCGAGTFLQVLKKSGYNNFSGYEMNESAIAECKKKGLPVYRQEEFLSENNLDAVFMFDVIEHVSNPAQFLTEVYDHLKPGGFLIVETSCNERLVSRMLGRFWWFLIPPNHVIIYNINSLEGLLSSLGYTTIQSVKINYHWISIQNAFVKINNRFHFQQGDVAFLHKDIVFPFCHFTSFLSVVKK